MDEQPFTRSLAGVLIPPEIERVTIMTHDLVSGYDPGALTIDLSVAASGPKFEIEP